MSYHFEYLQTGNSFKRVLYYLELSSVLGNPRRCGPYNQVSDEHLIGSCLPTTGNTSLLLCPGLT